jgi:type IV pilus assembly protein PilY1
MNHLKTILGGLGLMLVFSAGSVLADDTDIYLNPGSNAGGEPLVMFTLDIRSSSTSTYAGCSRVGSAPNFCPPAKFFADRGLAGKLPAADKPLTFLDALRLSLELSLRTVRGVKVGLMINHDDNNNCAGPGRVGCSNGGYVLRGFRSLVPGDTNGSFAEFTRKLDVLRRYGPDGNGLANNTFNGHPYQGKELFFELYRYLIGGGVYNGRNGWANFNSPSQSSQPFNTSINLDSPNKFPPQDRDASGRPELAWDPRVMRDSETRYISPIPADANCSSVYTINFFFGNSQAEAASDSAIIASPAQGGMGFAQRGISRPTFDDVLGYLNTTDLLPDVSGRQTVTSYFIFDGQQQNAVNGYARSGGTNSAFMISNDPQAVVDTINSILAEILSVSTTFVSASVPVNVFNRAEIVDNVYLALFQAERTPRWSGNVKKLLLDDQLQADGSRQGLLIDANRQGAVAGDGRIRFDALTFWTNPTGFDLTAQDATQGLFSGRDGRHTVRGGAGQQIPGFLAQNPGLQNSDGRRKLFYQSGATSLAALDANAATATALRGRLGAADDIEAVELIRYARGFPGLNPPSPTPRSWWTGDPMHSRPLPMNYGSRGAYTANNQAIYIAYGSNDGFFRMIRNTQPGNSVVQDGREVWAFMPDEALGIQKRLRDNQAGPDLRLHPYGVDGAPSSLMLNVDPQTGVPGKAYVYFGLRRGGSAYYALDVTDPENPTLQWRITRNTAGFSRLGQSFSRPQVGQIRRDGVVTPVLIFAAGYDTNKDYYTQANQQPVKGVGTADTFGIALYVVHAVTGERLWEGTGSTDFPMQDSIPSDVTIADTSGDGFIDRVLFGDTGGNVWRADLPEGSTSNWSLHRIGVLGRHSGLSGRANDRRFFHAPDLVQTKDSNGTPYDAVVIGSGDREDPLDRGLNGVPENWLYVIRDYNVSVLSAATKNEMRTANTLTRRRHDDLADISDCVPFSACQNLNLDNGWKLRLNTARGEKNLSTPFSFLGTIFFTTYLPPGSIESQTCGPSEGSGALYAVRLEDGSPRFNFNLEDDSSSPDDSPTTTEDRVRLLSSGGIPSEVVYIGGGNLLLGDLSIIKAGAEPRLPTFWRRNEQGERVPVEGEVE